MRVSARLLAFGVWCKQGADQRQLGLHPGIAAVKLQCFAVGLAGQLGIHIAQIFMRGGVARVGANRHFKRSTCLVKLALACVQNGQVVVGLRQLGVVLRDLGEGVDGISGLASFGLNHAFDKTHLRVTRFARQVLVGSGQGFCQFACPHQNIYIGVVIGMGDCGR